MYQLLYFNMYHKYVSLIKRLPFCYITEMITKGNWSHPIRYVIVKPGVAHLYLEIIYEL